MKKYIVTLLALFTTAVINAQMPNLDTNVVDSGKSAGGVEITFGGSGTEIKGESAFGGDFSISVNPFKARREVWLGLQQGLYWEPTFAASTDLFVEWSQNLWKEIFYINLGWSGGALYDTYVIDTWRTGPQATLQYYVVENAFIYAGVNYDAWLNNGDNGFRYSFGLGLSF